MRLTLNNQGRSTVSRSLIGLLGVVLFTFAMLGASSGGDDPAVVVHMTSQNKFVPATVTIKAGQSVKWVNDDSATHTVTTDPSQVANEEDVQIPSGAKPFNSNSVGKGKSFEEKFDVPGTYQYACAPHEGDKMVGKVVVTK
jgi:plastocyanin